MNLFHTMEKCSARFPRHGKKISTLWKTVWSSPAAVYLAIGLIAWIVRALYLLETSRHPAFHLPLVDAGEYHALARAWAEGRLPLPKLSWQPWFYPVMLGRLYALAGASVWAAKLLQITAGALTCVLTAALAFAGWPRPASRWIAGLAAAFCGPLIHFDGELLAEPWAALGLTAAALAAIRYRQRPRDLLALALGVIGGLLLFIRPPALAGWLPLGVFAGWTWIRRPRPSLRIPALHLAWAAVGFALAAIPFVHAIRQATGTVRLLPSSGGINFYIGNSARPCETLNIRPGHAWENLTLWPEQHGARTEDQKDAFYRRQALRDIRSHPGVFVRNLASKTRQFFCSRELPRNLDLYLYRDQSRILRALVWKIRGFGFPFGVLIGLAAIGLWTRKPTAAGPALAIAGYAAALIAIHVCGRYRIPVLPLFIGLAAWGILAAADALKARRFRVVCLHAAVLIGLGAATSFGSPFCSEILNYRAEFLRLLATTAYDQRLFALAESCTRQALAENPREAQAWNQLGLLAIRRAAPAEAEDHFRLAADIDPSFAHAWFNLGKAAARRGEAETAVERFREGLRLSPAYLPAWIELGDLLVQAGRTAEGLDGYREALRLRPGFPPAVRRLAAPPSPSRPVSR